MNRIGINICTYIQGYEFRYRPALNSSKSSTSKFDEVQFGVNGVADGQRIINQKIYLAKGILLLFFL
jgi:hypothetical protein